MHISTSCSCLKSLHAAILQEMERWGDGEMARTVHTELPCAALEGLSELADPSYRGRERAFTLYVLYVQYRTLLPPQKGKKEKRERRTKTVGQITRCALPRASILGRFEPRDQIFGKMRNENFGAVWSPPMSHSQGGLPVHRV